MDTRKRNISPFLILIVLMIVRNLIAGRYGSPLEWLTDRLIILPGIIIGLSFHEFAHAFVSDRLGDQLPRALGRVTLNPLAHIDPIGFLALLVAGFGWGKPVPINSRYYKNPRRDEALVAVAGVTLNFVIALVATLALKLVLSVTSFAFLNGTIGEIIVDIISHIILINLVLMFFNLLPVPPLDGFNLATQIFKLYRYDWYPKVYQYGNIILLLLVITGVIGYILNPLVTAVYRVLINLAIM